MKKYQSIISYLLMNISWLNRMFSDQKYVKILYKLYTGKKLNLVHPTGFNEKMQWLKVYGFRPEYTKLVDKYLVKQYVAEKCGSQYVIPLLGVYKTFEEIDFTRLPNQFVIKCNHDSGSCIIVKDKSQMDMKAVEHKIKRRLGVNYYQYGRDTQYKYIEPKIIIEEYMEDNSVENSDGLMDYKFFCFSGEPKIMYLGIDRGAHHTTDFFDMEFNHLDLEIVDPNADICPKKPERFEEMRELATILCGNLPFVRMDFYIVNHQVYFGEFTIIHNGGLYLAKSEEWERKLGDWIKLPCD